MSAIRARGAPTPEQASQRCAVCDADVLFLATCPACGSPTGQTKGHVAADPPPPPQQMAQMVSFADAARARNRTTLPEELLRAWQPPAPPRRSVQADELLNAAPPGRRALRAHRPAVLAAIAVAVVAAGSITAVQLSHSNAPSRVARTTPSAPAAPGSRASNPPVPRYQASGMPFSASFPAPPAVSHQRLRLIDLPYTATSYVAASGATTVSVGVYPLPIGSPRHYDVTGFVRSFLGLRGSVPTGTHVHAGSLTKVQGMAAVMLAGTADGGQSATFGTVVLDGHIAYVVLALGPATSIDATFHAFMAHFRIVRPSIGWTF